MIGLIDKMEADMPVNGNRSDPLWEKQHIA
jgi:hypothetical protein